MTDKDHRDEHVQVIRELTEAGLAKKAVDNLKIFLSSFNYEEDQLVDLKINLDKCYHALRDGGILGSSYDIREGTSQTLIELYYELANLFHNAKKWGYAVSLWQTLLEFKSLSFTKKYTALKKSSEGYEKTGQLSEAMRTLEKLFALKPDDLEGIYRLGILYGRQHQYLEAIMTLEKYLALDPNSAKASEVRKSIQQTKLIMKQKNSGYR